KVLVGTQNIEDDPRNWIRLGAYLSTNLPKGKDYQLPSLDNVVQKELALGWGLASYQFQRFKTNKNETSRSSLVVDKDLSSKLESEIAAVSFSRDLVNTPSNELRPSHLSAIAEDLAKQYGLTCNVIIGDDLLTKNFPMIHAVGKGSDDAPRLIELRGGSGKNKVTIVGKAVCFDTGGYDIKPSNGMRNMKKDMGGGALSLGLTKWLCEEKLDISFRVLIPAVENRISDKAFLPGDIIKTRLGKFVEIDNTDAEGRLVLCDALAAASEEDTDMIIDFATLTGACRVALGPDMPGFFTGNDSWANDLQALSFECKDPVWRLPLWRPYFNMLKSGPADLVNSASSGFAGAITAALYLKEFVKDASKWMHFDTYCWSDDSKPGTPQGADTQALRAVFSFLEKKFRS
ncbi:MAG: leucyl aminopeptidase family protein, partial [Bdellovibrionales bacterium]|nr:leucyl aminopeptidase family protein [Bdellovibrionales bacterium]